jgi:hypothetical protein
MPRTADVWSLCLVRWGPLPSRGSAHAVQAPTLAQPYTRSVSTPRKELHQLVERLPDEQVPAAAADLKARLTQVPAASTGTAWPPAWFGIAEGSAQDVSERVEEILAEGLGRRPA